jgi:hypothetical protein
LLKLNEEKVLNVDSKWRDIRALIEEKEEYKNLYEFSNQFPRELYEDFCDDLEVKYLKDKKVIKNILKDKNFIITKMTKLEELEKLHPEFEKIISIENLKVYLEDSMYKIKEKNMKKYKDFLKTIHSINETSKYEEYKNVIEKNVDLFDINTDEERKSLFYYYTERLNKNFDKKRKRNDYYDDIDETQSKKPKEELNELEKLALRRKEILEELNGKKNPVN